MHFDCCNGVSIHPSLPILASSSGQHHFSIYDSITSEDDEMNEMQVDTSIEEGTKIKENSLIFWWCGKLKQEI